MMTVGEMRHAATVEAQLRRIADALEKLVKIADGGCLGDDAREKTETEGE